MEDAVPRDSMGHPLPPPVTPFATDQTPRSLWETYWQLCPEGDRTTTEVFFLATKKCANPTSTERA